jgi:hypothetical protein
MKLKKFVDLVGLSAELAIMEGRKCHFKGKAFDFYGHPFSRSFRSRKVLCVNNKCGCVTVFVAIKIPRGGVI